MYMNKVNNWLTLVANFGVIVGLVLVAMQMKLATDAINQQSDIELSRGIAEGELAFMGETTANALSLIHISEPTRQESRSRMPSSA